MNCKHCGKSIWDGVVLIRQNAGEKPAIWSCENCPQQCPETEKEAMELLEFLRANTRPKQ